MGVPPMIDCLKTWLRWPVWSQVLLLSLLAGSGVASTDICAFNNANQLIEAPATIKVSPTYPTPMLRKNISGCVVFSFGLKEDGTGLKKPTAITVTHATREGRAQFVRAGRNALKKWVFHKDLPISGSPRYFAAIRFRIKSIENDEPDSSEGLRI